MKKTLHFESRILLALLTLLLPLPLFARCPISPNGALVVRAPAGNLNVETTGVDGVDVDVSDKQIKVQETCEQTVVTLEGSDSKSSAIAVWRIRVPKTVNLDLVASAGGITVVGDSEGSVVLRTGGGSVTTGNIKGQATIVTQAGYIKAGNIGGGAELRSVGNLDVGNVTGKAFLKTDHGAINTGLMGGDITAETEGGKIHVADARGELRIPNTRGGDILIDKANRVQIQTDGGSIHIRIVHGFFQGDTEAGFIRIDQAASSVEASTRQGEIEVHLVPENPNSSLHINLKTDIGGIILYLPKQFKASIEAIVDRPLFTGESIIADFPMNAVNAFAASARGVGNTVGIGARRPSDALRGAFASGSDSRTGTLNGGGNSVKLHANLGTISIKLKIN